MPSIQLADSTIKMESLKSGGRMPQARASTFASSVWLSNTPVRADYSIVDFF
jgi:hypothetical protein